MLLGLSAPPRFNGFMWSITYSGHALVDVPVTGQGCCLLNSFLACVLRVSRPRLYLPVAKLAFEYGALCFVARRTGLPGEVAWVPEWDRVPASAGSGRRAVNVRTRTVSEEMIGSFSAISPAVHRLPSDPAVRFRS